MARKNEGYTHIRKLKTEILEMVGQWQPQREIAEHFGFKRTEIVRGFYEGPNAQHICCTDQSCRLVVLLQDYR